MAKKTTSKKTAAKASSKKPKKAKICGFGGSELTYHKIKKPVSSDTQWPSASDLRTHHVGKRFYIIPADWGYVSTTSGGGSGVTDPPPKIGASKATYTINADGTIAD